MATIYFEKARELGELILQSEQSARLNAAREAYNNDSEATKKLEEYSKYQNDVNSSISQGAMSQEEFQLATKRLTEWGSELKQDAVIGELVTAENEFGAFVNSVMNVMKITITGEAESCSSEGCAGCSGCH